MRPTPLALLLATAAALTSCSDTMSDGRRDTAVTTPTAPATTQAPLPEPVDPLSPRPAVESPAPTGSAAVCDAAAMTVTDADLLADERQLQEVFAIRTTGAACALRGWPGVSLLGAGGTPIPVTIRRSGTATTLTLDRATSLSFVLGTPRSQDCQDVSTVAVRLPGTNRTIRAATTMQVCDGTLTVSPVQRRQDDEGSEH